MTNQKKSCGSVMPRHGNNRAHGMQTCAALGGMRLRRSNLFRSLFRSGRENARRKKVLWKRIHIRSRRLCVQWISGNDFG